MPQTTGNTLKLPAHLTVLQMHFSLRAWMDCVHRRACDPARPDAGTGCVQSRCALKGMMHPFDRS